MTASATSLTELNILKQFCKLLNVSHSEFQEKHETCVPLDDIYTRIYMLPRIPKGYRLCDKCRKTIVNLLQSFGNETVVSPSPEYGINEKETCTVSKLSRPTLLLP
jgi:hypothetical protein